jgi:hypothetical protein
MRAAKTIKKRMTDHVASAKSESLIPRSRTFSRRAASLGNRDPSARSTPKERIIKVGCLYSHGLASLIGSAGSKCKLVDYIAAGVVEEQPRCRQFGYCEQKFKVMPWR